MKSLFLTLITVALATTTPAQTTTTLPEKPEVVLVQGGTFTMGSNVEKNETTHNVSLSSYSIGKYPVTVGQYKKYCTATGTAMPEAPSWGWNDKHPMVKVNYYEAVAYCNWLGNTYGGDWRLPTEAQWEFAARGGTKSNHNTYSGSNDLEDEGGDTESARGRTQVVGHKKANKLGIYDMSDNVWEWCKDWYGDDSTEAETKPKDSTSGAERVLRGGNWFITASFCRVADRISFASASQNDNLGFRVVLSP